MKSRSASDIAKPLLVLLMITSGCSDGVGKVDFLGNFFVRDVLASPDKTVAIRLLPAEKWMGSHGDTLEEVLEEYQASDRPVTVEAAAASSIVQTLWNESSYDPDSANACELRYGVQLRFSKAGREVDVLLCFDCSHLTVFENGKQVGGGDFDPAHEHLAKARQPLFPEDEAIQSLLDEDGK